MNLAKISANGQITVPVEIRWLLGLKSGDKILFFQKQDGEIVVSNASSKAIRKAQGFPHSKPARALLYVADNHEIVLCDRSIMELRDILKRKAPKFLPDAEVLFAEMSYELIPAVDHVDTRCKRPTVLKCGVTA